MYETKYNITTLANGVRIITENIPHVRSVAIGIWVGAGSRLEDGATNGISHFLEHLMFKGTEKRSAREIAEALDSVGGQLNAFTSREYTCYYARVLDEHLNLATDVLADMFFNSTFPAEEIDKERGVILEEVKMYEDSPDELIHDLFAQNLWPDNPLGHPIIGKEDNIRGFTRSDFISYLEDKYTPDKIVIAVTGNFEQESLIDTLSKYFGGHQSKHNLSPLIEPTSRSGIKQYHKDTAQLHLCMGVPALKQDHPDIYTLNVLNTILGGGQSSRLVQKIREERGLAYSVYTYHGAYSDSGLFALYGGISPVNYQLVQDLMFEETRSLATELVPSIELERAKEQLKGGIMLGLESVANRMSRLGRSLLTRNKVTTPEEIADKINLVSSEQVRDLANRLFTENAWTITSIGPNTINS